MTPGLTKTYNTGGAVTKRRFVKFSADRTVVQAAAATDKIVGVSDQASSVASGDRADIKRTGIAEIEYGGNVARGDFLTADANGKAVVCNPAAGATARYGGVAEVSGVAGDIGEVLLSPGQLTTPAA